MPTYLVHGFRWHRSNIRIHIILNDIEDASPEWLMAPRTSNALLNSFYTQFDFLPPSYPGPIDLSAESTPSHLPPKSPSRTLTKKSDQSPASLKSPSSNDKPSLTLKKITTHRRNISNSESEALHSRSASGSTNPNSSGPQAKEMEKSLRFNQWSVVKLLEQYDPDDLKTASQPWAYVSDYIVEVGLGVSISEEVKKYKEKLTEEEIVPSAAEELGMSAGEIRRKNKRAGWFDRLRQNLEMDEEMGWFVVVCGDEERWAPPMDLSDGMQSAASEIGESPVKSPKSPGFRKFFRRRTVPASETGGTGTNGLDGRGFSRGGDST
ncbi:dcf12247-3ea6-4177-b5af-82bbf45488cb [Sclerotinia trifoliorum]|uniref:Dcf12247-3ea6-4177-b5af-82bbf45488cb n=1 Tax=Sclerotinia trifoliorum TaxID=28548 RepID=A0A8H2W6H6_9HELO|nr:dcf12247-3ea6-4177-b5af-82bbf45488cb [Sclerotinia trifoliorum]